MSSVSGGMQARTGCDTPRIESRGERVFFMSSLEEEEGDGASSVAAGETGDIGLRLGEVSEDTCRYLQPLSCSSRGTEQAAWWEEMKARWGPP